MVAGLWKRLMSTMGNDEEKLVMGVANWICLDDIPRCFKAEIVQPGARLKCLVEHCSNTVVRLCFGRFPPAFITLCGD